MNAELERFYKTTSIVTTIRIRRLEWVGRVQRMSKQKDVKKVYEGSTTGRRCRG